MANIVIYCILSRHGSNYSYLLVGDVDLIGDSVDLHVECAAGFPIEDLNTEEVVVSSPATQSGTLFV